MTNKRSNHNPSNDDVDLWELMKTYKWLTTYIALITTLQLVVFFITH